jgi:hypothetical protein
MSFDRQLQELNEKIEHGLLPDLHLILVEIERAPVLSKDQVHTLATKLGRVKRVAGKAAKSAVRKYKVVLEFRDAIRSANKNHGLPIESRARGWGEHPLRDFKARDSIQGFDFYFQGELQGFVYRLEENKRFAWAKPPFTPKLESLGSRAHSQFLSAKTLEDAKQELADLYRSDDVASFFKNCDL